MVVDNLSTKSKEGIEIRVAAVGDVWAGGFRRLAVYDEPEFMELVDLIRDSDVGFVNMETVYLDDKNKVPYRPIGQGGMGFEFHYADNIIAKDLRWMGFNICSCSMNHTVDWGFEGVLSTRRVLDDAGFTHAGTGETLSEASRPGYMQTKNGAVAIVSTNFDFNNNWANMATDPTPLVPPGTARPGANTIRIDWVVDPETFKEILNFQKHIGGGPRLVGRLSRDPWYKKYFGSDVISVGSMPYYIIKGKEAGTYVYSQMRKADFERNLLSVKEAAGMADWVIFSVHDHIKDGKGVYKSPPWEGGAGEIPSKAAQTLAKAVIEAGADFYVGHACVSSYQGIEIYKGKPIFYNIGIFQETTEAFRLIPWGIYDNLFLPLDTPLNEIIDYLAWHSGRKGGYDLETYKKERRLVNNDPWPTKDFGYGGPDKELYWTGLLVKFKLEGEQGHDRKVTEIKLYPADLRGDMPRAIRGRPLMAKGKIAEKVLERIQKNSEQFGTKIEINDNVGTVVL